MHYNARLGTKPGKNHQNGLKWPEGAYIGDKPVLCKKCQQYGNLLVSDTGWYCGGCENKVINLGDKI